MPWKSLPPGASLQFAERKLGPRLGNRAKALNFAFVFGTPVLCSLAALAIIQLTGSSRLNPVIAFILVSLFNTLLTHPLLMMPLAVKSCSSAVNSFATLDSFLMHKPLDDSRVIVKPVDNEPIIEFVNVQAGWHGCTNACLHSINLSVRRGEVLAIIGDVGSGKSSLIAAMLGELNIISGTLKLCGY